MERAGQEAERGRMTAAGLYGRSAQEAVFGAWTEAGMRLFRYSQKVGDAWLRDLLDLDRYCHRAHYNISEFVRGLPKAMWQFVRAAALEMERAYEVLSRLEFAKLRLPSK